MCPPQPRDSAAPRTPRASALATVFGLDVRSARPLPSLEGARAAHTGRRLHLRIAEDTSPAMLGWEGPGELVCDQRESDGSQSFRIEAKPRAGYLIAGTAYGSHLLSPDGTRVTCMPEKSRQWQRLLIAQVLPFASLLQGLDVLHASAVMTPEGVLALTGPSRSGKTSLALALCRNGMEFFADDVLALEHLPCGLLAHPGTPVAGVAHSETRRLKQQGDWRPCETLAVNPRERVIRVPAASAPARVRALFLLERRDDENSEVRFEPVEDPRLLLGATFNSVLRDRNRLRRLLELCALLAAGPVERVIAGGRVDAGALAEIVEQRLQTLS